MLFAPLEGWRHVKVTDRRTAADYAHVLRELADKHFPDAKRSSSSRIISTPTPASFYEAFAAEEAATRQALHLAYTPKHGSWLDMAESELGVLARNASIVGS